MVQNDEEGVDNKNIDLLTMNIKMVIMMVFIEIYDFYY